MVNILIRWLIFLHILAALTFFLAHGTSAAMAIKIRKETDFTRIGADGDRVEPASLGEAFLHVEIFGRSNKVKRNDF